MSTLACLLAYVMPLTATIGALLLTGYLGGATATQVRVEDPWFLFPIAVGVLMWGALWLRDPRIAALSRRSWLGPCRVLHDRCEDAVYRRPGILHL